MALSVVNATAVALYLFAGVGFGYALYRGIPLPRPRRIQLTVIGFAATALHAAFLYQGVFSDMGVNLGFFNAMSLVFWLAAMLLLIASFAEPLSALCAAVLPLAGISLLLEALFPSTHLIGRSEDPLLNIHILISVLSFSLLSIATVQALLLAIQNAYLHNRHPGGFIRVLPPLETMESLLFKMIALSFVLQTISLASGSLFLENMFAQHLAHKTILSITAWVVFAVLLWGRWRFGWRGRKAVRWTLGGILTLLLAYFGSKLVLELLLRESW